MSRVACPSFWNNFRAFRRHAVGLSKPERVRLAARLRLGPLAVLHDMIRLATMDGVICEDEARRRMGL